MGSSTTYEMIELQAFEFLELMNVLVVVMPDIARNTTPKRKRLELAGCFFFKSELKPYR